MTGEVFHLPPTQSRACDIHVFPDRVTFSGKFWYLRDKDFYSNHDKPDFALTKDFLGMGYLTKRSYRKTVLFVFFGVILQFLSDVTDKPDKAITVLNFLPWFNLSMPSFIEVTSNILTVVCLVLAVAVFFSKKKVVEISFTTKRICIPQSALSTTEFNRLREAIKAQKR